jgi:hypothetical protein
MEVSPSSGFSQKMLALSDELVTLDYKVLSIVYKNANPVYGNLATNDPEPP